MKKFLSVMLAFAMIVSCVSVVAFAADTKTVVNGNAENGLTGWETMFMGGTAEVVDGGANGTAHAIKYTSGGTYHSVGFDVTAKIIQDEANGYNGCGVGEYTISFYAKTESDDVKFHVGFDNAPKRDNASWVFNTSPITVSDEWEEYEITVDVSDTNYDVLKAQYDAGNKVVIRLDGSKDEGYKAGNFVYYIDEVVVTGPDEETDNSGAGATKPEVKVPTGFKVTYNEETTGDHYLNSKTGVFTAADVKNGEITKVFNVKNNSEETIGARVEFQVTHTTADGGKTWKGPVVGEVITIEPGETEELSYTAEVENGKVTVEDAEYDISALFVRVDFFLEKSGKTLPEGTSATVYCEQKIAEQFEAGTSRAFGEKLTFELVYDKVSNSVGTGDVLPVAFIALTAVATIALVVVSKKKREEF